METTTRALALICIAVFHACYCWYCCYCESMATDTEQCMESLPLPPPPGALISFLQRVQSAALSVIGKSSDASASSMDPKTYVDLPLRYPLNVTAAAFDRMWRSSNGESAPDAGALERFFKDYFYEAGSDLQPYTPPDYSPHPSKFLPTLNNKELHAWALKVHAIWLDLARKVSPSVAREPHQHTLLPLPKPVIIPGARFREVYYWDSYWIIRGLIVSKMLETAKGVVENLLHLVEIYGFVPNGGRIYYENRSEPPLLSAMVREVYLATGDILLLQKSLSLLIREHNYWTSGPKAITIIDDKGYKHSLSRYYANWIEPRPESYIIDIKVAENVPPSERSSLFHNIASGAESGWDFSSRWMQFTLFPSQAFSSLLKFSTM